MVSDPAYPRGPEPRVDAKPRRRRGVLLNELDRTQYWVIGHNGRRWETLDTLSGFLEAHRGPAAPGEGGEAGGRALGGRSGATGVPEAPGVAGHPLDRSKPPAPHS